jgi:RsiW-degrading membrane proteinase PrsW (M82 family)
MYFIIRNNQSFGPYDKNALLSYVETGKILAQDKAYQQGNPTEIKTGGHFLNQAGLKIKIKQKGSLISQLKDIGRELIVPSSVFSRKEIIKDKKLLVLALVGLAPTVLIKFTFFSFLTFYSIALYFSVIWGLFFFYLFKTTQVKTRTTIFIFFITQILVFFLWDVVHLPALPGINILYSFVESHNFFLRLIGFILGVGVCEEIAKALPLFILAKRTEEPIIPQTLVFYGLMSGIGFGVFEGVQYQTTVNVKLDYDAAFFMNVARLTSLPFLHAVWAGIAGYFISFANLYPRYGKSLYLLAIAVPALLHGLYNTLGWSLPGLFITFIGVVLLMNYLRKGVDYQSKLSN